MALIDIAITDMVLVTNPNTVVASISITGNSSPKASAGNPIYVDGLSISVSNITVPSAGATIPDPGPYSANFSATAKKVKAREGSLKLVLRNGDETGIINATPKIPNSPSPIDFPISFTVVIDSAGQIKAKAQ